MGLSPAGDWCCHWTDVALEGVEGAYKSVDNILVQAKSMSQLEERLTKLLERLKKFNIIASNKKFMVGTVIEYGGYVIGSSEGGVPTVGPNPARLQAMRDIKPPTNKKDTERLLGLFRTFNAFSPQGAFVTTFLRRLT